MLDHMDFQSEMPFKIAGSAGDIDRDLLERLGADVITHPVLVHIGLELYFIQTSPSDYNARSNNRDALIDFMVGDPHAAAVMRDIRVVMSRSADQFISFDDIKGAQIASHPKIKALTDTAEQTAKLDGIKNAGYEAQIRRLKLLSVLGLVNLDEVSDFPDLPQSQD